VQPCRAIALGESWASFQAATALRLDALVIDDVRRDVAAPLAWSDTTGDACLDVERVERAALGLSITADIAIPRADLRRMTSSVHVVAIGARIDVH
jgi:hypothetical protein